MQARPPIAAMVGCALLLGFPSAGRAEDITPEADFCEFPTVKDARRFGWDAEATNGKPVLEVVSDCRVGRYAVKGRGKEFMGDWGTLVLTKDIDLSQASKGDKIVFYIKQNVSSGIYLNIEGGLVYRSIPVSRDQWQLVEMDLDPGQWTWGSGRDGKWGRPKRFAFYAREFTRPEHYLIIDGLSFRIGGKLLKADIPPSQEPRPDETTLLPVQAAQAVPPARTLAPPPKPVSEAWATAALEPFPQENEHAWLLGNAHAVWAVSKQNGSILGGWNRADRRRCLQTIEGGYFLEDRKSLISASENGDSVASSRLLADSQELRITCTNSELKNIEITKTYAVRGGTLSRTIRFASGQAEAPWFLSYRSEARLDPGFRQEGSYVGAGAFGPIEAATDISEERQPLFYTNSRGMVLSNPVRGYSLAHYRLKQDEEFLLPWWSYSRAESAKDCFYYTPAGWKMPMGISRLAPDGSVSYEEEVAIVPGNYHDFVTKDYGTRDVVRGDLDSLGSVPTWLADVKVYCVDGGMDGRDYTDFNSIKRMVEVTDEGHILVLVNLAGHNLADYYVDQGLVGLHGGLITGPELREWIQKIKGISPRIKVGIYCYMDMARGDARLCKQHPEWFRAKDKEGNPVDHFAGFWDSRTTMFNSPDCRKAVLDQYDLMFRYLKLDFIYLDDALTNNLVNWETGEVLRDADCYAFFRGMREVAHRNGPDKALFFNGTGNPYGDIEFIEAYGRLAADFWRPFAGVGLGVETFLINRPGVRVIPLYWTPPLGREYVNRVLALGWIPALEYTPVVDGRPFVSASYEIGNTDPVNADYQPDWKKQKDLKIESYAVRRPADGAAVLSFISHEDRPSRQTVSVQSATLGLDPNRPLYVWLYRIKDATAYQGFTTERLLKSVYAQTGWTLDLIATPEFRYAGEFKDELSLDVELQPLVLTMLVVSNEAAAVYSLDDLPMNFLFAKARGVGLTTSVDLNRKEILVDSDSERDRCEIVGLVAPDWSVKEVSLDGKAVCPGWIALGDTIAPSISVGRKRHAVRILCESRGWTVLKLQGVHAALTDRAVEIRLPPAAEAASEALVVIRRKGDMLFNRMVKKEEGVFRVPLAPQRGGTCEIAVKAVQLPTGLAKVDAPSIQLSLPSNPPDLGLPPLSPGTISERKEILEVNKRILGLDVLRTGIHTTPTTVPPFQTELKGLTVEVFPDTLTIDAGTTRKIEGYLGAAFGGFEIKELRTVRVELNNTYAGATHIQAPNVHTHLYYPSERLFAGIMVDYHTGSGYTKRVAMSVGVAHPDCNTPFPSYGKGAKPDQVVSLGPVVLEGTKKELELDLSQYAPAGWDGQVWFSVGSDWALPGRRLTARLLSANATPAGKAAPEGTGGEHASGAREEQR
ncbi:MAG: hypothetical protein HUU20_12525 [Pirellulales bacterium]|nr:hypothetical protein [Pirellulales bacterium]